MTDFCDSLCDNFITGGGPHPPWIPIPYVSKNNMAEQRTRDVKAEINVKSCNVTGLSKLHLSLRNTMFMYYMEVTSCERSPLSFDVYNE